MADTLSTQLDTYFDRTRKTIGQWVTAHINAELQRINGSIIYPIKKPLIDIYEYISIDSHLSSVLQQRKSKVLAEEFAVMDSAGNINEDLTKLLGKQWFSKVQEAIIDAKFYGYSLIEVQELIDNEIKTVKLIPRGNVVPELKSIVKNPYQVSAGSLISIDNRNDSDYYVLIDSECLGLLNLCAPIVMMKRLTLSQWAEHGATFGIPPLILKTDNKDQIAKYQADMQRFIQNRNIVIGLEDSLEMLQQSGSDVHNIYSQLISTCNTEISKAVLSGTMTTDDGASRSQGEVHERVADQIAQEDRAYMTYAINDVVFPKLISLGYKLEGLLFKFITKEKRSFSEKLSTIEKLTQNGFTINPDSVKQYLDLPFDVETKEVPEASTSSIQKKSPLQNVGLNYLEGTGCSHIVNAAVDDTIDRFFPELELIVDQIISDVYSTNIDPLDPDYIRKVGELMSQAVYESFNFNGDFDNSDFDLEDLEFITALRKNTYYFVGGKNKALKQSFTELLFDGNNLRSFSQFKQACDKVSLQFNKDHLKTEYQTAISNAQSAADWNSFEDDDLLEYSAVMDGRTRPEHARLNGLTLPKSDKLWNTIAPINSWGCRCRLVAVPSGKASKLSTKERNAFKKVADPAFKFNPGSTGDLFPPDHQYLRKLSKEEKLRIDSLL